MSRTLRSALCAAALALAVPAQDEAAFDRDWLDVQRLIARQQWLPARTELEQLLEAHARQLYVLAARDAIAEDHKRCCFHLAARQPRPEELISGELLRWDAGSGLAVLRYQKDHLQDFEAVGTFLLHPATFLGTCAVTVTGTYPRDGSLQVVYDVAGESWCLADCGAPPGPRGSGRPAQPMSFFRGTGQQQPSPYGARARSPAEPGRSYVVRLQVDEARVQLSWQHKPVLTTQRDAPERFRVGIGLMPFDDVTLEGQIEPAWLQGLVDQKLSDQRTAFEQRYQPTQRLPSWLFERPGNPRTPPKTTSDLPGDPAALAALGPAVALFQASDFVECTLALDRLGPDAVPQPARDFLQASALLRLSEPALALRPCERALAAEPVFTPLRLLHADTLAELRRSPQALAEMRACLQDDPGEVRVYERLVPHLLRHGAVDEAQRVLRTAKSHHGLWDELQQLDRTVAMAVRGPAWHRSFSCSTRAYEIVSDIDARVCADAGRILEELHRNLQAELGGGDRPQPERMRVFLFSGQAGYQDYCRQIFGNPIPHTGGLYSPVLKQLLIWNLPSRELMERTIRHEGCHQFVDRQFEGAPTWFDEGLAQFYEDGRRVQGRLEGGAVDPQKLAVLQNRQGLPRLRELVYGSRSDFYRNAARRYPHAWAFVHFLRRSTSANRARFAVLWDELKKGTPVAECLDLAFAGVEWGAFEAEFWTHVEGMGREVPPALPR